MGFYTFVCRVGNLGKDKCGGKMGCYIENIALEVGQVLL